MRFFNRLTILFVLSSFTHALHANIITNGSFENDSNFLSGGDETTTLAVGSTAMPGWSVVNDLIAWIGPNNPWNLTASDGDCFLDLTDFATGAPFGGVAQEVDTIVGATYHLGFDLGSSSQWGLPDSLIASAGDTSATFVSTLTGIDGWATFSLSFAATTTTTAISFIGESGFQYIGLDNVVLTEVSGPVSRIPAPGTVVLITLGGLLARASRRREIAGP